MKFDKKVRAKIKNFLHNEFMGEDAHFGESNGIRIKELIVKMINKGIIPHKYVKDPVYFANVRNHLGNMMFTFIMNPTCDLFFIKGVVHVTTNTKPREAIFFKAKNSNDNTNEKNTMEKKIKGYAKRQDMRSDKTDVYLSQIGHNAKKQVA